MANSAQARKRVRQAEKQRRQNASQRSMTRTAVKRVIAAIEARDVDAARAAYTRAVPILDNMVSKGILHKNKAARHKTRLNAHIKALAAA
ncbi:MAG: 30S ribosomal protein S20 [Pseudomonadales bacterium]|nr:30S ribosomal protein S20 [Pseudomonadales bacterium]